MRIRRLRALACDSVTGAPAGALLPDAACCAPATLVASTQTTLAVTHAWRQALTLDLIDGLPPRKQAIAMLQRRPGRASSLGLFSWQSARREGAIRPYPRSEARRDSTCVAS